MLAHLQAAAFLFFKLIIANTSGCGKNFAEKTGNAWRRGVEESVKNQGAVVKWDLEQSGQRKAAESQLDLGSHQLFSCAGL